jgi:hypothetical protein
MCLTAAEGLEFLLSSIIQFVLSDSELSPSLDVLNS